MGQFFFYKGNRSLYYRPVYFFFKVACVQMVDFETSSSKSEVSKSNSWKITSFLRTMALQREPFLTMFDIINLSPLLVTKKSFTLIIILSNYQKCPLPLNHPYQQNFPSLSKAAASTTKATLQFQYLILIRTLQCLEKYLLQMCFESKVFLFLQLITRGLYTTVNFRHKEQRRFGQI